MSAIDIEVIRHCVGADGTMRYRFTFNVSVDRASVTSGQALRDQIAQAIASAVADARSRFQAFGTSRKDGMPLPPVDIRAAAFAAGYDAGWDDHMERSSTEYSANAKAALDAYLAGLK